MLVFSGPGNVWSNKKKLEKKDNNESTYFNS